MTKSMIVGQDVDGLSSGICVLV